MRNIKTRILEAVTFTAAAKVIYGVVKGTLAPIAWENFIIGKCIPAAGLSYREADLITGRDSGNTPKGLYGSGVEAVNSYYVGSRIFRPFVKDGIKGVVVTTVTPAKVDNGRDSEERPVRVRAVASENIAYFFTRDCDAFALLRLIIFFFANRLYTSIHYSLAHTHRCAFAKPSLEDVTVS